MFQIHLDDELAISEEPCFDREAEENDEPSRCDCGEFGGVEIGAPVYVLACFDDSSTADCDESKDLVEELLFDVSSFFNIVEEEEEEVNAAGRNEEEQREYVVILLGVNLGIGIIVLFAVMVYLSRRKRKQSKMKNVSVSTDSDLEMTYIEKDKNTASVKYQAMSTGAQSSVPSVFFVRPGMRNGKPIIKSVATNNTNNTNSLPFAFQSPFPHLENLDRASLRSNFHSFALSTTDSELSKLLKTRFSARLSISTEELFRKSDVASLDIKSYKSVISEEDKKRQRRVKTESVRITDSIAKVKFLKHFGDKKRRNSAEWLDVTRAVVERVYIKLKPQVLSANEVKILESLGKEDKFPEFSDDEPNMQLDKYIFRLILGLNRWFVEDSNAEMVGIRCLLISLIYLQKIRQRERAFTLTVYNIHRLLCVTMVLAAKFTEDELISMDYWGDVAGLDMEEVNQLEEEFCFSSGFDFFVTQQELDAIYNSYGLAELVVLDAKTMPSSPKSTLSDYYSL